MDETPGPSPRVLRVVQLCSSRPDWSSDSRRRRCRTRRPTAEVEVGGVAQVAVVLADAEVVVSWRSSATLSWSFFT